MPSAPTPIARRAAAKPRCAVLVPVLAAGAMLSACDPLQAETDVFAITGGNPEAGRQIIAAKACGVCHTIPGIDGAHGIVGPPLTDFATRPLIAGIAPNRPEVLVRWIRNAPAIAPQTAMPDMGLSEAQARDAATYLYTLR